MTDDRINRLKRELDLVKTDFSRRIGEIEQQIRLLESQSVRQGITGEAEIQASQDREHHAPSTRFGEVETTPAQTAQPHGHADASFSEPPAKKDTCKTVASGLIEHMLPLFGPVTVLFAKLFSVYKQYQSQGKAPAFFMTIAGILTLVTGFGYLLQYSFSQLLGPVGKISIGVIAAISITVCGVIISKKRPGMKDYGASLIGLGVILAYLCAYFTGPFYQLLPRAGTFTLLAMLTGVAYVLAIAFQTRVVAVISLLGGVFAPLLMARAVQSPQVYLAYVLVLVIATLFLSHRINWRFLAHMAMVVSFLVIQVVISALPGQAAFLPGLVLLAHLFFYTFYIDTGVGVLNTAFMTRINIALFSSNIFFFLFILHQLIKNSLVSGTLHFLNATLLTGLFFCLPAIIKQTRASRDSRNPLQMISLLSAGLLAGFGILSLTAPEFLGLVWGVEALVLFMMGARFGLIQVRVESYVILIISFVSSFYHAAVWAAASLVPPPEIFRLDFGYGWMNLMAISILLGAFVFMMKRQKQILSGLEKKWLYGCDEVLSVCLSLCFLMSVGIFWSHGIWLSGIFPMMYLIYRSKTENLPVTEIFGISHFLLLAVPMLTSAGLVESLYFSEQLPIGQIARVEAFLCLYLIAEFYRRFHPESRFQGFVHRLRLAFFSIIPVCFLPGVWYHYGFFFPFAVWISAGICLGLCCWLRYDILFEELKGLVIGASIISSGACAMVQFFGWQGHGFLALGTGLGFFSFILLRWQGLKQEPSGSAGFLALREKFGIFFSLSFYYLGIFMFILIYGSLGSAPLALAASTLYFCFLAARLPLLVPLKNNGVILYVIVGMSAAAMTLAHLAAGPDNFSSGIAGLLFRYGVLGIFSLSLYGVLIHHRKPHLQAVLERLGKPIRHFQVFHILSCLTYLGVLAQWFKAAFGPAFSVALVLHATILLFLTLKHRFRALISLAVVLYATAAVKIIFFDMNEFSLVQKMIAFIIIGALLLGAAYKYQRLRPLSPEGESG